MTDQQEQYQLLFNEMLSGLAVHEIICDQRGTPVDYRFLAVNPAFERLTGLKADDILGRTVREVMPATELVWIERYGRVALTREPAQFESYSSELGRYYEVRAFSPEPGRFAVVFNDITERKEAEEAIRRLNAELEQRVHERTAELEASNKELEAFAYSVSHDLRAPLRALDGFSDILLADKAGQLDGEGQQFLWRIQQASRRMDRLIDDLLNLSRIARRDMDRQPIDVSAMARHIAIELQQSDPSRQAEFVIPPDIVVNGDARLLHVVLVNLLGNAWKFTAPRPQARIELGTVVQDGQRVVFVRDNGVGFDMAYAGKLFQPFQRLHGMDEFPGAGIGLATVQRILARHGARVWAEAVVGQGATFSFVMGKG